MLQLLGGALTTATHIEEASEQLMAHADSLLHQDDGDGDGDDDNHECRDVLDHLLDLVWAVQKVAAQRASEFTLW